MQLTLVKKVLSDHDHACTLHITCATPSVAPRRYTVNPRSLLPRWTFYNTMAQQYRFGTVDTRSLVRLGIVSCRVHTCPFPSRVTLVRLCLAACHGGTVRTVSGLPASSIVPDTPIARVCRAPRQGLLRDVC